MTYAELSSEAQRKIGPEVKRAMQIYTKHPDWGILALKTGLIVIDRAGNRWGIRPKSFPRHWRGGEWVNFVCQLAENPNVDYIKRPGAIPSVDQWLQSPEQLVAAIKPAPRLTIGGSETTTDTITTTTPTGGGGGITTGGGDGNFLDLADKKIKEWLSTLGGAAGKEIGKTTAPELSKTLLWGGLAIGGGILLALLLSGRRS